MYRSPCCDSPAQNLCSCNPDMRLQAIRDQMDNKLFQEKFGESIIVAGVEFRGPKLNIASGEDCYVTEFA